MITNETIIKVLNQLEKEYSWDKYKDCGREFIYRLAVKLINTEDDDRKCVIEFFLNQIELESSDHRSTALRTIEKMQAIELAPRLEEIYYKWHHIRSFNWNDSLVFLMIMLKYKTSVYASFFTEFKHKEPQSCFYTAVLYSKIEPEKGLELLAELLYLEGELQTDDHFLSKLIYLIRNSAPTLLLTLVSKIAAVDKERGEKLRLIMIAKLKEHSIRMMCEEKFRQVILDLSNNNF